METVIVTNEYFEKLSLKQNVDTLNNLLKKPFPAKISYWISRFVSVIQSRSKEYFNTKQSLVKKYAELDEQGNVRALPDNRVIWNKKKMDDGAAFTKEFAELLAIEVDLKLGPVKVNLEQLDELGVTITAAEWALLPFIEPEDPS